MVKHTKKNRLLLLIDCLSVYNHFVGRERKGLNLRKKKKISSKLPVLDDVVNKLKTRH